MSLVPGVIVRNWRLKLAALGLAVFLWAVVRAEPEGPGSRTLADVPVLVEVGDLDWTTAGPPQPASVDVRVAGAFGAFGTGDPGVVLRVPVDSVSNRDTIIELRRDWVVAAGGASVQVQDINPPRVRITLEETAETAVPISLPVVGELPGEVALAQPLSVNPAVVRVRGRRSRVEELDSVALRPLDLSTITESGSYPLAIDTTGFADLSFRTSQANVDVRLEESVEQVFAGVSVQLDSLPEGVDSATVVTRPATIQVTLRGGRTRVERVRGSDLEAVVPSDVFRALQPGEQRVVPLRIRGVPDLVRAYSAVDSVRLVRLSPGQVLDTAAADTAGVPPDTAAGLSRPPGDGDAGTGGGWW